MQICQSSTAITTNSQARTGWCSQSHYPLVRVPLEPFLQAWGRTFASKALTVGETIEQPIAYPPRCSSLLHHSTTLVVATTFCTVPFAFYPRAPPHRLNTRSWARPLLIGCAPANNAERARLSLRRPNLGTRGCFSCIRSAHFCSGIAAQWCPCKLHTLLGQFWRFFVSFPFSCKLRSKSVSSWSVCKEHLGRRIF